MKTQLENHELDLLIDLIQLDIKEFNEKLPSNPEEIFEMLKTVKKKLETLRFSHIK
jgi:hypothetical protein